MTLRAPGHSFGGEWRGGAPAPPLDSGTVHLWAADFGAHAWPIERLRGVLSGEERERAARFLASAPADRYVVARGLLRHLLARYVATAPDELEIGQGPFGKPVLRSRSAGIRFNLSHSEGLFVCAIARDVEVGVDLERVDSGSDVIETAPVILSASERCWFDRLAPADRVLALYRVWTRKEAFLKAAGVGLTIAPDTFSVVSALGSDLPTVALDGRAWALHSFEPAEHHAGAIACAGPVRVAVARTLTPERIE